jgi:hypothetical protein
MMLPIEGRRNPLKYGFREEIVGTSVRRTCLTSDGDVRARPEARALVTGGAGFTGSQRAEHLLDGGWTCSSEVYGDHGEERDLRVDERRIYGATMSKHRPLEPR